MKRVAVIIFANCINNDNDYQQLIYIGLKVCEDPLRFHLAQERLGGEVVTVFWGDLGFRL